MISLQIPIEC